MRDTKVAFGEFLCRPHTVWASLVGLNHYKPEAGPAIPGTWVGFVAGSRFRSGTVSPTTGKAAYPKRTVAGPAIQGLFL